MANFPHLNLPTEDEMRAQLHNEIHARPSPNLELSSLVFYVAVINSHISLQDELRHLQLLSGQSALRIDDLRANFYQIQMNI